MNHSQSAMNALKTAFPEMSEAELMEGHQRLMDAAPAQHQKPDWREWPEGKPSYTTVSGNPSIQWRGISVRNIREVQENLIDAHGGVFALNRTIEKLNSELLSKVRELLGIREIKFSSHACTESPTESCVYGPDDPCRDDCLFCHEPNERK